MAGGDRRAADGGTDGGKEGGRETVWDARMRYELPDAGTVDVHDSCQLARAAVPAPLSGRVAKEGGAVARERERKRKHARHEKRRRAEEK